MKIADAMPLGKRPTPANSLLLVLLLALLLRLATFNGALGSDDLVYFGRAVDLARGEWTSANYNGALRYGFNLPAAAFIALFGENLFVANLWPLMASLLEIAAVYVFAESVMNRRAALFSALLLATAPLHMAVASRIHADAVVSMFLTLAFVLLYFGAIRRHVGLLFAAGLAIGGVFWTKELALVTWFAILPMVWLFRGNWRLCIWPLSGAVLMVLLHLGLMDFIAGDPLHLVKVVTRAVQKNFVAGGQGEDGAAYYLKFLFFDIRHTGFLGFFAILSIGLVPAWLHREGRSNLGFGVALLWWLGLLVVLSLFPVSLSPLRLTMKQSNYITLFLAPMALLAGMAVAAMPPIAYRLALALSLSIGSLLGVLQQADYRAYTANSKAVAVFSAAHPNSLVIGSANNSALGNLWARLANPDTAHLAILDWRDLAESADVVHDRQTHADAVYVVLDRQTLSRGPTKPPTTNALACWSHVEALVPADLSWGNRLAASAAKALHAVKPLADALDRLARPEHADVYQVMGANILCRAD